MSKENFFETELPEIKAVEISLVSKIMMKAYSELGLDEIQLIGDAEFALYFRNKEVIPCSCTGNKGADKYRLKLDNKAKESSKQFLKLEPTRMIRETSSFEMEKRLDSVLLDMYKVKIETEIDKTSDVVNVLIVNPSFYFIDEWIRYFYENDRYSKRLCTGFILETRGLWEYLRLLRKAFAPHRNVFFRSADEIPELKSKMNGMKNLYYFLGCFFYRNKFNSIANERIKSIFRCCDEVIATYEYRRKDRTQGSAESRKCVYRRGKDSLQRLYIHFSTEAHFLQTRKLVPMILFYTWLSPKKGCVFHNNLV